jgi:nicotinamidase-related amidase
MAYAESLWRACSRRPQRTILSSSRNHPLSSGTTLHSLLNHLEVTTLVLAGVAADVCILFTAHDAHLRDYQIIVPSDCVASNFKRETTVALANMKKATHALVCESPMIHFSQGKVRTTSGRAKALPRAA